MPNIPDLFVQTDTPLETEIIAHHNWTWENLIILGTNLRVIKAADYLAQTQPEKQNEE